jgi:TPR repeat protein
MRLPDAVYLCALALVLGLVGCRREESPTTQGDGGMTLIPSALRPCDDLARCASLCDAGQAAECLSAANAYQAGQGTRRDEGVAAALFLRGCELGDAPSCTFAGRMYEYAHGVAQDLPRTVTLYERACERGYLAGCYNLALMLERGRGTVADVQRARELYRRVCEGGSAIACDAVTRLAAGTDASVP